MASSSVSATTVFTSSGRSGETASSEPTSAARSSQAGSSSTVWTPNDVHIGARPSSAITAVDENEPIAPKKSIRSRTGVGRTRTGVSTVRCMPP